MAKAATVSTVERLGDSGARFTGNRETTPACGNESIKACDVNRCDLEPLRHRIYFPFRRARAV